MNDFFIELESIMGSIRFETKIPGLSIWLNGKDTGEKTPHIFENIIPDRDYAIKIEGEEYYSDPVNIRIKERENKLHHPTLKPYPTIEGMIFVKGGSFQMGSNEQDNEKPIHSITVSDFYIGKYEVTQKEWKAVMGNNPSHFIKRTGFLGFGEKYDLEKHPVEQVSWYDAVEFCNKKSEKEGLQPCYSDSGKNITCDFSKNGYRLPTEAEWEYAARGGTESENANSRLYSGSNTIGDVAWYSSNSGSKTHQVGTKQANELGIHDMSGNVWEWCWDWHRDYTSSSQTNPRGASSGSYRVARGGSWGADADYCRVAIRGGSTPDRSYDYVGFRLCRSS